MHVILGASGQVGSAIVEALLQKGQEVRGVIRNPEKSDELKSKGADVAIADIFDVEALTEAFQGGGTAFILTPENPKSKDVLGETEVVLRNYKEAIRRAGIKKVVGLSSMGAQHRSGTGDLEMSYMLEHLFEDSSIEQVYIRPAYYYSNWMAYADTVEKEGVLPTFFPVELKIAMVAPVNVAAFVADKIADKGKHEKVYEIMGPSYYSSADIADAFGETFGRKVNAQQIPRSLWKGMLIQAGFSDNAADGLMQMTDAVINGLTGPEKEPLIRLPMTFQEYLRSSGNV